MVSVSVRVAASTDDAHHRLTTDWYFNTTTYLRIGYVSATDKRYRVGMRFLNITIPKGATILTAIVTLTARYSKSDTTVNCILKGELVADAATFSTSANFDGRARTVASVAWNNIGAWTAGLTYDTPSIVSIIQEIVNQAAWASGNDLVVFWDDDADTSSASREAVSWDQDPNTAPLLVVTYIVPVVYVPWHRLKGKGGEARSHTVFRRGLKDRVGGWLDEFSLLPRIPLCEVKAKSRKTNIRLEG